MRGYPQFSFWISIAPDIIYLSHKVIIWEKILPISGHCPQVCDHVFTSHASLSSSATFMKGIKITLVFPNYVKHYAGTIYKGLVIDKGLRLATPLGKRPSLELHISTDAS